MTHEERQAAIGNFMIGAELIQDDVYDEECLLNEDVVMDLVRGVLHQMFGTDEPIKMDAKDKAAIYEYVDVLLTQMYRAFTTVIEEEF